MNKQRVSRILLRAGAGAYSAGMLAEAALRWPLNPATTLLSELAARDRAYRRIFQGGDVAAGVLFSASGMLQAGKSSTLRLSLGVLGTATIADAFSPLDYPISDERLKAGDWEPSGSHKAHFATTTVAGAAAAGVCWEHWRLARRLPVHSSRLRRAAAPTVVGLMLAGVAALASTKLAPGLLQRVQTIAFGALCWDLARLQEQAEVEKGD